MTISIIGAGAAGCFCAIRLRKRYPDAHISIYEASRKILSKLARTGGGRCNLTNSFAPIQSELSLNDCNSNIRNLNSLAHIYPRGERLMKRALQHFGPQDTIDWFEAAGVPLMIQPDQRVFPLSEDAMQIVRCLERQLRLAEIQVVTGQRLSVIQRSDNSFTLHFADGSSAMSDKVVLTIGGNSTNTLRNILPDDIPLAPSVPSLFTFKIQDPTLRKLMGTSVENASLSLYETKFHSSGTILITDWGLSGPAVLKLSSYAAKYLSEQNYCAELNISWSTLSESELRTWIQSNSKVPFSKRSLLNLRPQGISERLWQYLIIRSGLSPNQRWAELPSKSANKLISTLLADTYPICGRAAFKEEFVTCGGVDLSAVNLSRLESKTYPGLFFAGEVLDIDAVTGGFNLQAAWSSAAIVADSL